MRRAGGLSEGAARGWAVVRAALREPPRSPESYHELHRALRRLRIELAIRIPAPPGADERRSDRIGSRLRRISARVGKVRDVDIALELFGRYLASAAAPGRARTARRLRAIRADRIDRLEGLLRRTSADGGLDEIPVRLRAAPRRAAVTALWAEEEAALRQAIVRVQRRPGARRLHTVRIRLRRLRQLAAASTSRRSNASRRELDAESAPLQKHLGALQDLKVAEVLARRVGARAWAESLRRQRRVRQAALVGEDGPLRGSVPTGSRAVRATRRGRVRPRTTGGPSTGPVGNAPRRSPGARSRRRSGPTRWGLRSRLGRDRRRPA